MQHFNALTPAQLERLALLQEEMAEAQQAIGKILRHGLDSFDPTVPEDERETNRGWLERELGDVEFAIRLLCGADDLSWQHIGNFAAQALDAKSPYFHHQRG